MSNAPVYRAATKADLAQIVSLELQLFGDHGYPDFFFRQCIDCWPNGLRLATLDGRITGYILITPSEQTDLAWILSLAVDTEFQGRGIGWGLVKDAIASLSEKMTRVKLTVDPNNPAVNLYLALGFVEQEIESDYFGPGQARIVMQLRRDRK
ncbi:GNAT family N-acetyltransferase [Shewanella sp. AS1]|uniref:GNAT family N-acetyltransferase n=1 Tax=Shewanella sp. AS1 TaxID=2907626 RepID=UPI001F19C85A|nr:N-acetyltransferase [Shewanella sp. AS1]MCE9679746.1 GNAT family N-acetyltransferase [Shewanella sp. AS1]